MRLDRLRHGRSDAGLHGHEHEARTLLVRQGAQQLRIAAGSADTTVPLRLSRLSFAQSARWPMPPRSSPFQERSRDSSAGRLARTGPGDGRARGTTSAV